MAEIYYVWIDDCFGKWQKKAMDAIKINFNILFTVFQSMHYESK